MTSQSSGMDDGRRLVTIGLSAMFIFFLLVHKLLVRGPGHPLEPWFSACGVWSSKDHWETLIFILWFMTVENCSYEVAAKIILQLPTVWVTVSQDRTLGRSRSPAVGRDTVSSTFTRSQTIVERQSAVCFNSQILQYFVLLTAPEQSAAWYRTFTLFWGPLSSYPKT